MISNYRSTIKPLAWGVIFLALAGVALSADEKPARGSRLVLIKVDGLPPDLMAAVALPERAELFESLTYAADLKKMIRLHQQQTGRQVILPNIRHYFYEQGVWTQNFFSETLTLSAAAWAVIDTGQPSVIKGHATFSRDTSYLRSHLDGLRDTIDAMRLGESKTAALWNLDQIGVSLMTDAFAPYRVWSGPQVYRRSANRELLLESGKRWLHNDQEGVKNIVRSHLSRLVTGLDYTVFAQEMSSRIAARKILEKDLLGAERFDYISPLFTLMDHQQHVDPHPENLIYWLVELDQLVGEIFLAVESSERRNETIVAMVSDHGSEIDPGRTAFSFPITKVFRTPLFGSHNVKTLLVESAWNALSVPVPGIDFPRIYESSTSPYKGKPGSEDDVVTCFIDNFGNARSSVNLRNDDLNRLHLLLLELKQQPSPARRARIKQLFQQTLQETRDWLAPDLDRYEDYHAGSLELAEQLDLKVDKYSKDVAWRLRQEAERDRPQIERLRRLLSVRFQPGEPGLLFDQAFDKDFVISDFLPKQFLGQANSVHQLSRYTVGLDEQLNWVSTTVDPQGRPTPANYFEILTDFRAANAPANGIYNPYDLIATPLTTERFEDGLPARELVPATTSLRQAVWLKSTTRGSSSKGGEALVLRLNDGRVRYVAVKGFNQREDGKYHWQPSDGPDPLGLLGNETVRLAAGGDTRQWLATPRGRNEWMEVAKESEYGIAVLTVLDILDNPVPGFVDDPEFQKYLIHFKSEESRRRYLNGLKRKYANSIRPDFVVWANPLWNFNSKARTSGGSHSGLKPIVSKTTFVVWGGDKTRIARGRQLTQVGTTLDIVPTLFNSLGMLDEQGELIRHPSSIPERTFQKFPGQVLDIYDEARSTKITIDREDSGQ